MSNPWGITARESQVLNLMCEKGSGKIAARELGISDITVSRHLAHAAARVGARTRTLLILEWDRWTRAQKEAA